jgi:hypothetical protein
MLHSRSDTSASTNQTCSQAKWSSHFCGTWSRSRLWQDRLTPLWKWIGVGCHLNRNIDELIEAAGFRISELKASYLPGPRVITYTYHGIVEIQSLR